MYRMWIYGFLLHEAFLVQLRRAIQDSLFANTFKTRRKDGSNS